ncbi:uncharacterized protein K460DRAFT_59015 [Cucurbitaria berberidis CBS 394.84]|uniref:Uncharacterized protein n=1 Tax=Cucurbitaria berberidis CBS 394.84 TaxID=1168544 RepID=A0A9P4LAL4_9PLEO|nr:uncharacterized protein K460DRAFT_59015 [Cucurbitaria berberidis CBS 394.84]KAF1847492.1 hypothetical protein K460DRAFT_59015 [Cucurbitaria berberidis CBS 394.84]
MHTYIALNAFIPASTKSTEFMVSRVFAWLRDFDITTPQPVKIGEMSLKRPQRIPTPQSCSRMTYGLASCSSSTRVSVHPVFAPVDELIAQTGSAIGDRSNMQLNLGSVYLSVAYHAWHWA